MKMVEWLIYSEEGEKYTLKDIGIRSTPFGEIPRKDLLSKKKSLYSTTSKNKKVLLLRPDFADQYFRMKRGAQPINQKDCGLILAETLVGKDATVFDCGSGMGGLTCFLARYVKKVYSMDNNLKHIKTVQKNIENLGLKNVELFEGDVYNGIPLKKTFDLITIDVPQPERTVAHAKKKLKEGGYFVAYCPQALQMHNVVSALREHKFEILTLKEVIVRRWVSEERILRPDHVALVHTGFLVFARKTI